ncbi:MAG: amidoligase family protein [Desulfobacterales bacterium]
MMTESNNLILHLKSKYPMLQYFTEQPFGVEIEFFGLNYVITPIDGNIIKPYCISSRAIDGRHFLDLCKDYEIDFGVDSNSWHFEKDSSVRGKGHTQCGAELTSPILSGIEGLVQTYRAFQFLCNIDGIDIDNSCGLHVHHGVDFEEYGCEQLRQLVRIVHKYEDQFYLLIPGDRQNAETCRPMEIDVKAFLDICECELKTGNCRIKQLWYSPENRYDIESTRDPRYDKTRYHGLNLHSYWYRNTIEFRYHSSVLYKIDEAMQWIIFTQFIMELSRGHVPKVYFSSKANKWLQMIYKIYEGLGYQDRLKKVKN